MLAERQERPTDDDLLTGRVRIVSKIGFNDGVLQFRPDGETRTGMILIRPGDLVVSGINAAKGAIAVYGTENEGTAAATIHYGAYSPKGNRVDTMFLWWLLRSGTFRELLHEYVPGGIKTELKAKRLLPVPIPLPPLSEQRRIVARIEELAGKVTEARDLHHAASTATEVLGGAVMSTICAQAECQTRTVRQLLAGSELRNGRSVKSSGDVEGVRCLILSSMRDGRIDVTDAKPVPLSRSEADPFLARKGDVFVMRGNGSKRLCGRAGLVVDEPDSIVFPDLFIHVPLPRDRVLPEFFVAAWNSASTRKVVEEKAKTTSGIWKINQGHIETTSIPVPPVDIQRQIVAELDALQTKLDEMKRLQAETQAELDALMPSILDRAFKGEL